MLDLFGTSMVEVNAMETPEILWEARETLGLALDDVERRVDLPAGSLERIEHGAAPLETAVLDRLAHLYGLHAADVVAGVEAGVVLESVKILLKASTPDLSVTARSDVARVAAARRELRMLEDEFGRPNRYDGLRRLFKHEGVYGSSGAEWKEAKPLAARLRSELQVGECQAIASVRDIISQLEIELVTSELGDSRVAGFSLSDRVHGPAIVVNMRGPNSNPWIRRTTLAHELCHVLHDEKEHREMVPIQLYEDTSGAAEVRANAFAAHFLAPDMAVLDLYLSLKGNLSPADIIHRVMSHFGINFKMARYRLSHACRIPMADFEGLRKVPTSPERCDDVWRNEAIWDEEYFPCPSVPRARRGLLTRVVVNAWRSKKLDRGQAVSLLEAAPDEPLEVLLDLD